MSSNSKRMPSKFDGVRGNQASSGESSRKDEAVSKQLGETMSQCSGLFKNLVSSVLNLSGIVFEFDDNIGHPRMDGDDFQTCYQILENLSKSAKHKNNHVVVSMKKKLDPMAVGVGVFLHPVDLLNYANFMRGLVVTPLEFFDFTDIDNFQVRWKLDVYKTAFKDIGQFATDAETMTLLRSLDDRLRRRFRRVAAAGSESETSISSNSAFILLLRIEEYTKTSKSAIDENSEIWFALLSKLLRKSEDVRTHLNCAEVKLFNRLYDIVPRVFSPEPQVLIQSDPPTKAARNLLILELTKTLWLEGVVDAARQSLFENIVDGDEIKQKLDTITHNLSHEIFRPYIPKPYLLEAFEKNIPAKPIDPRCVGLNHRHCCHEIKKLQDEVTQWEDWATRQYSSFLVRLSDKEKADLFTASKQEMVNATITCLIVFEHATKTALQNKELELEVYRDQVAKQQDVAHKRNNAELEKVRKEAAKREAAEMKAKENLRMELKAKEVQLQKMQKAAEQQSQKEHAATKNDSLAKSLEALQASLNDRARVLKQKEDKITLQEQEFQTMQRKGDTALSKKLKQAEAQIRDNQAKISGLEKELEASNNALNVLQLDFDVTVAEINELKKANTAKITEKSKQNDSESTIQKLQEEVTRYKGLYQAARSNDAVVKGQINKAVREAEAKKDAVINTGNKALEKKDKELLELQETLQVVQKAAASKSIDDEAKMLAALATRDESIRELSRAKLGLQNELESLKRSRQA